MSIHRRGFLGALGAGFTGVTGLVLPTAAQARLFGRRGGNGDCCPPPCVPGPAQCGQNPCRHGYGEPTSDPKITVSFPIGSGLDPSDPTPVLGNGSFATWGTSMTAGYVTGASLKQGSTTIVGSDISTSLGTAWGYAFKGLTTGAGKAFQIVFQTTAGQANTGWFYSSDSY